MNRSTIGLGHNEILKAIRFLSKVILVEEDNDKKKKKMITKPEEKLLVVRYLSPTTMLP